MEKIYTLLKDVQMDLDEYEELKLSDIENKKIKKNILSELSKQNTRRNACDVSTKKHKLSFAKVCASVAIIACVSSITVAATSNIFSSSIKNLFKINSTQKVDVANEMGFPVNISSKDNGIKCTAEGVLRDLHHICVVYKIERTDGKTFDQDGKKCVDACFDNLECKDSKGNSCSGADIGLVEENVNSNYIKCFTTFRFDNEIGNTIDISLGDIKLWNDSDFYSFHTLKGNWKFTIRTDYKDCSVNLANEEKLNLGGGTAYLKELNVSPMGFYFEVSIDGDIDDAKGIIKEIEYKNNFTLHLKDGTIIPLNGNSGPRYNDNNSLSFAINGSFDQLILLDEMDKVCVSKYEFKIK